MIETTAQGWRGLGQAAAWLAVEPLLPGATLFALLLALSLRFVREGFDGVRQHAFAPGAGTWSSRARAQRSWWSCTCANPGACKCAAAIARGLRRCCATAFPLGPAHLATAH